MMPSAFVPLDRLPLTANGKVDRAALPAADDHKREDQYVAPQSETEIAIAGMFSEVLGVEKVGLYDSFFDIGGDSLLAVQLIGRIRKVFGVDPPLRLLFENPTVQGVAEAVETLRCAAQDMSRGEDGQDMEMVEEGMI